MFGVFLKKNNFCIQDYNNISRISSFWSYCFYKSKYGESGISGNERKMVENIETFTYYLYDVNPMLAIFTFLTF